MRRQAVNLPPVLQVIVALDIWNELAVLRHAPWLGRLLAASILRQTGVIIAAHLAGSILALNSSASNADVIAIVKPGCSPSLEV